MCTSDDKYAGQNITKIPESIDNNLSLVIIKERKYVKNPTKVSEIIIVKLLAAIGEFKIITGIKAKILFVKYASEKARELLYGK